MGLAQKGKENSSRAPRGGDASSPRNNRAAVTQQLQSWLCKRVVVWALQKSSNRLYLAAQMK